MRRTFPVVALMVAACISPATELDLPNLGEVVQGFTVDAPAAVNDAEPAVLTPCPTGWSEVDAGVSICEPWAADAGSTCAADQARFPGDSDCQLIGTPCTGDDFASGLPDAGVLFVNADAGTSGDGTRALPFGTVAAAMAVATPGSVVALGKGAFAEDVAVSASVTVWGACAAQTHVQQAHAAGLHGALTNLTVTGPGVGVTANPDGNSLSLTNLVIDGAAGIGVLAGNTAVVDGHDVVIRNTKLGASGTAGRGIDVEYAGHVTLTRVALENNHENAVNVTEQGSFVSLTDAVLRGTLSRADGNMGRAATVNNHAKLELTRVVLEQNHEAEVALGNGGSLKLTDAVLRDTLFSIATHAQGNGIVAEVSSTVQLSRVTFARNHDVALQLRTAAKVSGSHVALVDNDGVGLDVEPGSDGTIDHLFVARNTIGGIGFNGATGTLTDVDLEDTTVGAQGISTGMQVSNGSTVTLTRARLNHNEQVGVLIAGTATLDATDLLVSGTTVTQATGDDGTAIAVQDGAVVTLTRIALLDNRTVDLFATGPGTSVTASDATLQRTMSSVPGLWGRGVHVQGGAALVLTRALIDSSSDVGLFAGSSSTVQASSLSVTSTAKRACVAAGACVDVGGSAVVVLGNASLTAHAFSIAQSVQCGLQLAEGGVADLQGGEIRGHPIGACVATDGFDVSRISGGVVFQNNQRNLDAEVLPLPDAMVPPLAGH